MRPWAESGEQVGAQVPRLESRSTEPRQGRQDGLGAVHSVEQDRAECTAVDVTGARSGPLPLLIHRRLATQQAVSVSSPERAGYRAILQRVPVLCTIEPVMIVWGGDAATADRKQETVALLS